MENFKLKTKDEVLKALHPTLKKDLISLNKLDEVVEEIKTLNIDSIENSWSSYCIVDEYSFLWPTIISFGSEKLGVALNIYKN